MSDITEQDNQKRLQEVAKLKWILRTNIAETMNEVPESGSGDGEFDVINSDGLARTEIFYYYTAHSFDQQPRVALLTLGEIAQIAIPYSFQKNENMSKEIVSHVGQQMLKKFLISKAVAENNDLSLDADKLGEIEEEVKLFNLQRKELVKDRLVMEKKEKDPEYYANLSRLGRGSTGQHNWTEEENTILNEAMETNRWPEGHRSAGKRNWREITRVVNEETGQEFTPHQVRSVIEKRERTDRKRGEK